MLALAAADDDARSAALDALCERSVVAPTLSGSGDALRTLTNANGDKAMPLFSGKDTLQAAAKRFGWSSGDGAPAMRELSAREAMQSALVQGVQFVVFDVGAAHCVEFASDEVALMLAVKQARQRPAASPKPSPKPVAAASARKPRVPTAERGGMTTAPTRRRSRVSLPTSAVTSPGFVFDPGERTSAAPLRPRASAAPPAVSAGSGAAAPLPSVPPIVESSSVARPTIRPGSRGAVAGLPSVRPMQSDGLDALPSAGTLPGAPVESLPSAVAGTGAAMESLLPAGPVSSPAPQDSIVPRAPRMKPTGQSAVRPPSLSAPVDPLDPIEPVGPIGPAVDPALGLAFAPSEAQPEPHATESDASPTVESHAVATPPRAIAPPPAATEKASLKQKAKKGMDDVAGRSLKTAAKALAAILGSESASDKRAVVPEEKPAQATSEDDAQPDEPDLPGGALRPLQVGLSDPMQGAIADALRSYPEVEWACEVSDGSDLPVVAVRVSPSFTNRVAEIEAAVIKAASAREVSVRVLHLSDPAVMREARANGNTFFPWRKRPNRK